jgi:hypothetical protein
MKIELKPHEYAMMKGMSIKLDDDTVFFIAHIYHSTPNQRGNSDYRYEARIMKISDIEAEIEEMNSNANCLGPWLWPTESMKDKSIVYGSGDAKYGAKWLKGRIKKALNPDVGFKRLNGYKPTKSNPLDYEYKENWAYDLKGYTINGTNQVIDITDAAQLLTLTGKSLTKTCVLKTKKDKN